MKKILTGILTTAIVLSIGTTSALAAGSGRGHCGNGNSGSGRSISGNYAESVCQYYVNADGDGICDNCGTSCTGTGSGHRYHYVDADGDGVCDNAGTGNGSGNRYNYVDADGDGICDNAGTGARQGCGQGNGARRGCRR